MKCIGRPKLVYVNLTYAKNVDRYDYFRFECEVVSYNCAVNSTPS